MPVASNQKSVRAASAVRLTWRPRPALL